MAVVRYGAALGDYGSPTEFVNVNALTPTGATATLATLTDPEGGMIKIAGTGLTYGPNGLTGGTATGLTFLTPDEAVLFSITGLSLAATELVSIGFDSADSEALLGGRDRVYGSSNGDFLAGFDGNDTIYGGGGNDVIGGMNGFDELRGGAGKDAFVFAPNRGVDTVVDFADTGARLDDMIVLRRALYDQMTMTQEGDDVLLTFGRSGSLLILDQTLAEMGTDDFAFRLFF